MTKTEREKIREAIDLLMGDDCLVQEAVAILGPMCGVRNAYLDLPDDMHTVTIKELVRRPNQPWKEPPRKSTAPTGGGRK